MPRSLATRTVLMAVLLCIVVCLDILAIASHTANVDSDLTAIFGVWIVIAILGGFNVIALAALREICHDMRVWRQSLSRPQFSAALLRVGHLALLWISSLLVLGSCCATPRGELDAWFPFIGFGGLCIAWRHFRVDRLGDNV